MKIYFLIFFLFLFFLPTPALASTLFNDEFSGNGELSSYNNFYKRVTDFHPNTGTFSVFTNHLETTSLDPGYIYTGISTDNVCASIDFNWSGGNSTGNWTNIILHSTEDSFGTAFQIRNDDPTHHRWVFYSNGGININGPVELDKNITHRLKACVSGNKVSGYLDNILLFTGEDSTHSGGYMGFASQSPTFYLDNFKIETFNSTSLAVPLIKQTDLLWKNNLYDSANVWSPNDDGIGSWGCALTSAAMVFQYHNITKMPDNSSLNPDTLNNWLKNQPDGYVNEGWVNWLALSRLSKKAKNANPLFTYSGLEYKRFTGANKAQLTTDLSNNIPDILQVPGHFIVAKGIQNTTFSINDPYYSRSLLTDYSDSFTNLGRFTPSNTDLSYLMFYTDQNTSITVKDSNGNIVGESFIEEPIESTNNAGQMNGDPFTMFVLDKPNSDSYTILLNSSNTHIYTLHSFLYDNNGEVITTSYNGSLGEGTESYNLHYNKEEIKQNKIIHSVSYDSVIDDIRELESFNLILPGIADELVSIMTKAKNPLGITPKAYSLAALASFREVINKMKNKGIDSKAYLILKEDINNLTSFLTSQHKEV